MGIVNNCEIRAPSVRSILSLLREFHNKSRIRIVSCIYGIWQQGFAGQDSLLHSGKISIVLRNNTEKLSTVRHYVYAIAIPYGAKPHVCGHTVRRTIRGIAQRIYGVEPMVQHTRKDRSVLNTTDLELTDWGLGRRRELSWVWLGISELEIGLLTYIAHDTHHDICHMYTTWMHVRARLSLTYMMHMVAHTTLFVALGQSVLQAGGLPSVAGTAVDINY